MQNICKPMIEHDDFYCTEIISGKTPVKKLIDSELIIAFYHTKPFWEEHIVIIPKKHIIGISELAKKDAAIGLELIQAISQLSKQVESKWGGCRVSSNVGNYQSTKHLHFYIHAGKRIRHDHPETE